MPERTPVSRYTTVLFKLSGEMLGGSQGVGLDSSELNRVALELADVARTGVRTAVVVGGGNFYRGGKNRHPSISTVRSHQMGMLATITNALALEQTLIGIGIHAVVQSAVAVPAMVETYDAVSFSDHLDNGRIVIFAGGTGNTHVSTDTAAGLRAIEVKADILLKATDVDGIYSADPHESNSAIRYKFLTFDEVLAKNFAVMDATAIALCREHNLPVRVFDATKEGEITRVALGSRAGTLVSMEAD